METNARQNTSTAGEIKLGEMCEACAQVVPPGEGVRAEMSVSGAMCPSPMLFHEKCYELASALWQPETDSYCQVDEEFPETMQWTLPEQQQG